MQIDSLQPVSDLTSKTGCTIVSDGWSSTSNRPLLNFLAVNPMGAVFVKAVDTSGDVKDAAYIADLIIKEVEVLGPENVIQVITDNASACAAAGKLVERR
jgi:hypothetical protein